MGVRLSIADLRTITSIVKVAYGIDLEGFALSSLRRRIENSMSVLKFNIPEQFVDAIVTNKKLFDKFLLLISVSDTEMFRDPVVWRELRENILPSVAQNGSLKIWIPGTNSGEEMVSLLISLEEASLTDHADVYVTNSYRPNVERISKCIFDIKYKELSEANYERAEGKYSFDNYFSFKENLYKCKPTLLRNVRIHELSLLRGKLPRDFDLIIFRNYMLYYNKTLQFEIVGKLYDSLKPGGFLFLGVKETLDGVNADKRFLEINPTDGIYKRSYL